MGKKVGEGLYKSKPGVERVKRMWGIGRDASGKSDPKKGDG